MNKKDLIDILSSEAGISKAEASKAIDAFVSNIQDSLKKGDRVSLSGFGSFTVAERAARTGRNPQTGKEIHIASKSVVKFKAFRNILTDDTGPDEKK